MLQEVQRLTSLTLVQMGGVTITLGSVVAALVITGLFIIASMLVGSAIKRVRRRATRSAAALYLVEKIVTYGLTLFGIIAGLSTLGLNLASIAVFAGGLGIGIGLGLQGVVKEFFSGLVLIFDNVINVGDYIELETGTRGVVHEIGPRATRVRNNDNIDILLPNSYLIENQVTNWTLKGDTRRIHIPFGVAYGADKEKVREAVLEAAKSVPFTLPETETRKSQVWLVGFGDSSLNFELLVWPSIDAVKRPRAMEAAYTWAIDDALRKAGIEIPFPQRDIRIRSLFGHEGDDALAAARLERPVETAPEPAPAISSTNDAAEDLMQPTPEPEPLVSEEEKRD
ncbi:MAG: mechanosensitive ion channel [Hyphomonadaceae bacterium]